ncbi:Fructosamine kinase FrlD [Paenibacillus konkukensis]|uniref:Fructosamine kinase FrlD n=1 Tax=Paenibacillus konkukensis TaxID=2020716 RepID=A0ABY4RIE6_9BACL|nr:PfkB family carbohydrate kinase [Paenibacillus konkukensis]UQZ81202.1 Fructosamine kinase FrlD [Paenibacillus konkukensis]
MKMIAIGDNVVDCYLDQQLYYPGGNAVNVAVHCKRNGFEECAYIGIFGNDKKADHIRRTLELEQVTYELSRQVFARSGAPGVQLVEGNRVFVAGPKDTAQHIVRLRLMPYDLEYIATFDVCHTSCYSNIEGELGSISKHCDISFDFSTNYSTEYLQAVCPHIRYAFFSGAELPEERLDLLIETCHSSGTAIVGITLGERGALFSRNGERYVQAVKPTTVVDTMGAGDSFIAGFLTSFIKHGDMEQALDYAADRAAVTCTFYGAYGYPHPFETEEAW